MTGKRRKIEYSSTYVNIGLKNETHKALALLAGSMSFDTFIKKLLIHAATCRTIRSSKEDSLVILNNEILEQLANELR